MFDRIDELGAGFVFVRHGETLANQMSVACGGDSPMPMIDSGRQQMKQAATQLRTLHYVPELIICGDQERTIESAHIMQSELNPQAQIRIDLGIKERILGEWNGQCHRIVQPKMLAGLTPNNGESRAEFKSRVMNFFNSNLSDLLHWPLLIGSKGNARILLEMTNDSDAPNFPNGKLLKVSLQRSAEFQIRQIERL